MYIFYQFYSVSAVSWISIYT